MNEFRRHQRKAGWALALSGAIVLAGGLVSPVGAVLDGTTSTVDQTVETVDQTVGDTTSTVEQTVGDTVDTVEKTVDDTISTIDETIDEVEETIDETVDTVEKTVGEVADLPALPGLPGALPASGTHSSAPEVRIAADPGGGAASGSSGAGADGTGHGASNGSILRSSARIVTFLEELGATPAEIREVLAPFPIGAKAEFLDQPGDRSSVPVSSEAGAPVVAPSDAVISGMTARRGGEATLRLLGGDGTRYEYRGLDAEGLPSVGERVERGALLGSTAGDVVTFTSGPTSERFLADALEEATVRAGVYALKLKLASLFGADFRPELASSTAPAELPQPLVAAAALMLLASGVGLALTAPGVPVPVGRRERRRMASVAA